MVLRHTFLCPHRHPRPRPPHMYLHPRHRRRMHCHGHRLRHRRRHRRHHHRPTRRHPTKAIPMIRRNATMCHPTITLRMVARMHDKKVVPLRSYRMWVIPTRIPHLRPFRQIGCCALYKMRVRTFLH